MKALRIKDWAVTFETAESRKKIKAMQWFACPSGCDSNGFLMLAGSGLEGAAAFGVFIALCQGYAGKFKVMGRDGCFVKTNGKPMSLGEIAALIRMDKTLVEKALELLVSEDIGWLEWVDLTTSGQEKDIIRTVSGRHPDVIQTTHRRGEEKTGHVARTRTREAPGQAELMPTTCEDLPSATLPQIPAQPVAELIDLDPWEPLRSIFPEESVLRTVADWNGGLEEYTPESILRAAGKVFAENGYKTFFGKQPLTMHNLMDELDRTAHNLLLKYPKRHRLERRDGSSRAPAKKRSKGPEITAEARKFLIMQKMDPDKPFEEWTAADRGTWGQWLDYQREKNGGVGA